MGLPRKRPTELLKDGEVREHIKDIQEEATGRVLELSAAPTAAKPLLEDGERGLFNNELYSRVANTIYKFTSDTQIVI